MIFAFTGPFSVAAAGVYVFAMSTAGGIPPAAGGGGSVLGRIIRHSRHTVLSYVLRRL